MLVDPGAAEAEVLDELGGGEQLAWGRCVAQELGDAGGDRFDVVGVKAGGGSPQALKVVMQVGVWAWSRLMVMGVGGECWSVHGCGPVLSGQKSTIDFWVIFQRRSWVLSGVGRQARPQAAPQGHP